LNIDWTKFTLDANDTAYKQMMAPIETVASFSKIVVYVVALAGALILALLLMLSIKERMYETGVLLSMGEGKLKIIGQYVLEVLMVAILAFGLSCFSGKYIAQSAGNMLIQREIQTEQQSVQNQGFNNNIRTGGMGFNRMQGRPTYQPIDSINVQITPQEVGQATGAGILILILGTILPAASIMRFKPKAILTNLT
jgi:putative ABC transport system permease protein